MTVLRSSQWGRHLAGEVHRLESLRHRSLTWFTGEPQADEELLTAILKIEVLLP